MATNQVYQEGDEIFLAVASGVVSGDPVVIGQIPGVAQTDRDANGKASVDFDGVYSLSVKGPAAAVAVGDILYYAAGTPLITNTNSGVRFGYALGAVSCGATTTISVKIGY